MAASLVTPFPPIIRQARHARREVEGTRQSKAVCTTYLSFSPGQLFVAPRRRGLSTHSAVNPATTSYPRDAVVISAAGQFHCELTNCARRNKLLHCTRHTTGASLYHSKQCMAPLLMARLEDERMGRASGVRVWCVGGRAVASSEDVPLTCYSYSTAPNNETYILEKRN